MSDPRVDLPALLARPERVAEVELAAVPALLATLAGLSLALAARLAAPAAEQPSENGDALLTVQEVADLVRQDRAWVWRRARRSDWRGFVVKPSRKILLVSRGGLLKWLAQRGPSAR